MKIVVSDLLDIEHGMIVHGCNAQGVMGAGVADQIRRKYPYAHRVYHDAYTAAGLVLGEVIYAVFDTGNLIIANAITQQFFGQCSNRVYVDYHAVRKCMRSVAGVAKQHSMQVHFPKIGAGLARGDWSILSTIIDEELDDAGVEGILHILPNDPLAETAIISI